MEYKWYLDDDDYELAKRNGISRTVLDNRVRSCGWDFKRASTTPLQRTLKRHLDNEVVNNLNTNNIEIEVYTKRLKRGWSVEEASTTPKLTKSQSINIANNSRRTITDEQYKRAEQNGISKNTLRRRVFGSRWNIEKAINTPVMTPSECAKLSYLVRN